MNTTDHPELARFLTAQAGTYARALAELRAGRKQGHWMWFIFPQLAGLGHSFTARHYAIRDADEARAYLQHPVLGPRLVECTEAVNALRTLSASAIFGYPDVLKFRSSMTLFAVTGNAPAPFERALERYFNGEPDAVTLALLTNPATRGEP
jgi:uncharacterized protein (DUF1810 family)